MAPRLLTVREPRAINCTELRAHEVLPRFKEIATAVEERVSDIAGWKCVSFWTAVQVRVGWEERFALIDSIIADCRSALSTMREEPVYKEEDNEEQQHREHAACVQQRTRLYVQLLKRLHDGWCCYAEPN